VWLDRIVIRLPLADDLTCIFQTHKPVHLQAFIHDFAIKVFYVGVVTRFYRKIEHQDDPITMRSSVECLADEFRAVIDGSMPLNQTISCRTLHIRLKLIEESDSKPG